MLASGVIQFTIPNLNITLRTNKLTERFLMGYVSFPTDSTKSFHLQQLFMSGTETVARSSMLEPVHNQRYFGNQNEL